MLANPPPEMIRMTRSFVGDLAVQQGLPEELVGDFLNRLWLDEYELIKKRERLIQDYKGILIQVFMDLYNDLSRNGFTWQKLDDVRARIEGGHQKFIGPKFLSKLAGKVVQHFINLYDPLLEARPSTSKYGWDRGVINFQITAISMRKDAAFQALQECVDFINFWRNRQPHEFPPLRRPFNLKVALIENIRYLFPTKRNIPISNVHLKEFLQPGTTKTALIRFLQNKNPQIHPATLFAFDYNIQKLELSQLKRIGLIEVTEGQLNNIKKAIEQLIWEFFYEHYIGRKDIRKG